jgi:hypothetical protein
MYQQSRKMLIFLVVIVLADNIFNGVITAIGMKHTVMGTLTCGSNMCIRLIDEYQRHSFSPAHLSA